MGIDSGVQPVPPKADEDHGFLDHDVIRILLVDRLEADFPVPVVNGGSTALVTKNVDYK